MDFSKIIQHVFTTSYIFDFNIITLTPGDRMYMVLGLAMVIPGAVFKIISNFTNNPISKLLWHRLASPLVIGGLLEIFWYLGRSQNIRVFGSHFVAWLIALIILIWISFPIRYYFIKYKAERDNWDKQQQKLKYLKK